MLYSKSLFSDRGGKRLRCFVEEGGSKDLIEALLTQGGAKICRRLSEVKNRKRQHIVVARLQYKADKLISQWGWLPVDLEWVVKSCSRNCVEEMYKYRLGTRKRYSPVFESDRRKLFDQLLKEGLMKPAEGDDDESQNSLEAAPQVPFATSTQNHEGETEDFTSHSKALSLIEKGSQQSQPGDFQPIVHRFKHGKSSSDRPPPGRKVPAAGKKMASQQGFSMLVKRNETVNKSIAQAGVSECASMVQQEPGSSSEALTCALPSTERGVSENERLVEEPASNQTSDKTPANKACVIVMDGEKPANEESVSAPVIKETSATAVDVGKAVNEQIAFAPPVIENSPDVVEVQSLRPIPVPLPPHLLVDASTSPTYPGFDEEMTFFTRRVSAWKTSKPFRKAEVNYVSEIPSQSARDPQTNRVVSTFVEDGQVAGTSRQETVAEAVVGKRKQAVPDKINGGRKRRLLDEVVISSGSEDETREPAAARQSNLHQPVLTFMERQQRSVSRSSYNNGLYRWVEKRSILEYIIKKQEYYRVKGNALWEDMEQANICPGRSFQSMKEHFKKQLFPNISYVPFLTDRQKNLFKKYIDYDFRKKGIPVELAPAEIRHPLRILSSPSSSSSSERSPPPHRRRVITTTTTRPVHRENPAQKSPAQVAPASSAPTALCTAVGAVGIRKLYRQRSVTPTASLTQTSRHQLPAQPLSTLTAESNTATDPVSTAPVVASAAPAISADAARTTTNLTQTGQHQLPAQPLSTLTAERPDNNTAPGPVSTTPVVASAVPAMSAAAARSLEMERCFREAVAQPSPLRPFKRIARRPESSEEEDELQFNSNVKAIAPVNANANVTVGVTASAGAEITAAEKGTGIVEVTKQKLKSAETLSALESPSREKEGSQDFVENSPIVSIPSTSSTSRKKVQLMERLAKIRRTLSMGSIASPEETASTEEVAGAEREIGISPLRGETAGVEEKTSPLQENARSLREDRRESLTLGNVTPSLVLDKSLAVDVMETSGESTDIEKELRPGKIEEQAATLGQKLKALQSKEAHSKTEETPSKLQEPSPKAKKLIKKVKKTKELANSQRDEAAAETVDSPVRTRSSQLKVAKTTVIPKRTRSAVQSGTAVTTGYAEKIAATESASQIGPVILKESVVATGAAVEAGTTEPEVSPSGKIRVRSLEELNNSKDLHTTTRAVKKECGINRPRRSSAADGDEAVVAVVELGSDEECDGDLALQEIDRLCFVSSIQQMLDTSLIEVTPDNLLVLNIQATTPELSDGRELDAVSARCPVCGWLGLHSEVRYHDERASLAYCPLCPQEGAGGSLLKLLFWLELTVTIGGELMRVVAAGPVAEQLFCCSPQEYLFVEASRELFATKLSTGLRYHGTLLVATTKPPASQPSQELTRPTLSTGASIPSKPRKRGRPHKPKLASIAESSLAPGLPSEPCDDDSDVIIFLGRLLE